MFLKALFSRVFVSWSVTKINNLGCLSMNSEQYDPWQADECGHFVGSRFEAVKRQVLGWCVRV